MKKWIITYCILFAFISCKNGPSQKGNDHSETSELVANTAVEAIKKAAKNGILVCAHRSYHKYAPENSLKSIGQAIENGIDFIELDVRTTKDSILVLMHDDSIGRVTTGRGKISDYTFKELQRFSLKIGDSITVQKIPLVSEALKMAKGKVIPNLDLKALNYHQLYGMLKELGMEHEVISFIGKKKKVMEMIGIDSLYATLPLSKTVDDIIFYQENTLSSLQHFTDESFTPENMQRARESGQLIFVNTLWDEDDDFILGNTASMDSVFALRPAIIQTDHPKLLVEYLRGKKLHD